MEKSYVRKLFTPGWYRVNLRVSQTMLNHNQNLCLIDILESMWQEEENIEVLKRIYPSVSSFLLCHGKAVNPHL